MSRDPPSRNQSVVILNCYFDKAPASWILVWGALGPRLSLLVYLTLPFKSSSTRQFMFTSANRTALGNAPSLEMMLITHFGLLT